VSDASSVGHDSSVVSLSGSVSSHSAVVGITAAGDAIVTPAVLSLSTEGISEDTVVAALPASGVSVAVSTVDSIADSTLAVAVSTTASAVFSTTVSPVGSLDGGLSELGNGGSHGGNHKGKNDGNLSHA